MGIERLKREWHVAVEWVAFPLHPDTPGEGMTLEALFRNYPVDIPQMLARLKQAADRAGLPFGDRKKTFNSRLAQELGKWAEGTGAGDRYHDAVFRAYFRDGRNIGQIDTLLDIGRELGFSSDSVQQVLTGRTQRRAVDRDWARARNNGITAVPTFVIDGDSLVGAHPYDALEKFVRKHNAGPRGA